MTMVRAIFVEMTLPVRIRPRIETSDVKGHFLSVVVTGQKRDNEWDERRGPRQWGTVVVKNFCRVWNVTHQCRYREWHRRGSTISGQANNHPHQLTVLSPISPFN